MPRHPKYKKGDTVRGLKLIEPTHKLLGQTLCFAWVCRNVHTKELGLYTTGELDQSNRTPVSKLQAQIRRIFKAYRVRCRKKNIFFEITQDQFYKLSQQACTYCEGKPANGKLPFLYNGLDRKDNEQGYTIKNIVPCCAKCNGIKSNLLTYEEMLVAMRAIKRVK